jgi:hypothetical protein
VITWLLACAGPVPRDSGDPADTAPPVEVDVTPTWTAEEALAAAQSALDLALPDPALARDTYLRLVEEGQDADCPGSLNFNGADPLGCESDRGYVYAGLSTWQEEPGEHWSVSGDFEIRTPEGQAFHGGGIIRHGRSEDGGIVEIEGTWIFDGSDGWLDPGLSGTWTIEINGGRFATEGGITVEGVALHFDAVAGSTSGGDLVGTFEVRDPVGAWWYLDLGPDGCGDLRFAGELEGEGCLDLPGPFGAYAEVLKQ